MRILALSDMHCGHHLGLTPPEFRSLSDEFEDERKILQQQEIYWDFFYENVMKYGPYDAVVHNGDAIDGSGTKSGGTELISTNRRKQCQIAAHILNMIPAEEIYMTYGTPYHTGQLEDWEDEIADKIGAIRIDDVIILDAHGKIFNFKHHVGNSQVPWGRPTALTRDRFFDALNSMDGLHLKADIVIRSHVHYFQVVGGCWGGHWKAYTTPALMGYGPKYARKMAGNVDFGFLVFDVSEEGEITCTEVILRKSQAAIQAKAYIVGQQS